MIFNGNHCDNRIEYSFAIIYFAIVFDSCATPLLSFCLYIRIYFLRCFCWRGGQRGGEVEPMCENMRAKLQCYLKSIVRVVDVPVRILRRPAFLLILLTG